MNPIRVRRRRQRRLEIIDGFRITPPGQRYLSETVVRGSVTSLDLQGCFETSFRLFQAVYLKVDVTQVQRDSHIVRTQLARDLIATDGVVDSTFLLVQSSKQIDPAKIFRRQSAGIQITLPGRSKERISMINLSHRAVSLTERSLCCRRIFDCSGERVLQ